MKYAVAGVVLLLIVGGLGWCLLKGPPPDQHVQTTPQRDAGPAIPEGLGVNDIEIPDLGDDMGPIPDLGPRGPHKIIRYVYVGGNWDCSGDIPVSAIQQVVAENNSQVRTCYERRLKVKNTMQGNVTVSVRIGNNGAVTASQVGGSLNDNETFTCIRNLADHWHFPVPAGGACAVVRVPFTLRPQS